MSDKNDSTLGLTLEQRRWIEELAHRRGYNAPADYLISLVEEDEDEESIVAGIQQAWNEVITGQTRPVSELWNALKDGD